MTATVILTKHHATGNDFLVLVDLAGDRPVTSDLARELCDRRRGVGADGLIRATRGSGDADVVMQLFNADGSEAETSGNGLRCLGHAVLRAGVVSGPQVRVATAAGVREVEIKPGDGGDTIDASVDMGPVSVGPDAPEWVTDRIARASFANVGNPHLVLLDDDRTAPSDVAGVGAFVNRQVDGGVNVEFVSLLRPATLSMLVYERGVGVTEACGSGACAAAAVASSWGIVGDNVRVEMPGGDVFVDLDGGRATLSGPAVYVATVEVPWHS